MSVAAGVTVATFESLLPESVAVIRSMPNTPAVVGRAVTGVSAGTRSSDADLALAVSLFETVGQVLVVPEEQIDALSTISGSGPAYVFYLIEQLTAAAVDKGFTAEQAALMVQGTFRGASELLAASDEDPAELRRRVTSPKGTTERAIAVLEACRSQAGLRRGDRCRARPRPRARRRRLTSPPAFGSSDSRPGACRAEFPVQICVFLSKPGFAPSGHDFRSGVGYGLRKPAS